MSRSPTTIDAAHGPAFSGFGPEELMVLLPTHRAPTHPGAMLREEYLPDFGWSPGELAARLRVSIGSVEAVLTEKAGITPDLALRLARLFGQTPAFWIKGQLAYDLFFALKTAERDLDQIEPVDAQFAPVRKAS